MVAPARFELAHDGVRVHCLTAWPWGNHIKNYIINKKEKEDKLP